MICQAQNKENYKSWKMVPISLTIADFQVGGLGSPSYWLFRPIRLLTPFIWYQFENPTDIDMILITQPFLDWLLLYNFC